MGIYTRESGLGVNETILGVMGDNRVCVLDNRSGRGLGSEGGIFLLGQNRWQAFRVCEASATISLHFGCQVWSMQLSLFTSDPKSGLCVSTVFGQHNHHYSPRIPNLA